MSQAGTRNSSIGHSVNGDEDGIKLVDSTLTGHDGSETPQGSWRRLARHPTRTHVKEEISRRKYASWRKDRFDDGEVEDTQPTPQKPPIAKKVIAKAHPDNEESETVDFGARPDTSREEDEQETQSQPRAKRKETEIDVLYENQRGSFFCGIPLYSHSSLLNFDPSAWVTRDLKNSSVNITNAQVPDPSWRWAWKTWYVDMSHDVDEEGWQYSFSFSRNFAWHGTHPWFHSFVRRRRWLRKRVKRADGLLKEKEGTMEAGHHLTTDYFTIHSKKRGRSPACASNPDTQLARPVSFQSYHSIDEELNQPEEVTNVPSLMKVVRYAAIDREKIQAVKQFIQTGGDEVHYLQDQIPAIMASLVFQSSRRQVLTFLRDQAEGAQNHRDEHNADKNPERDAERRRIDSLLRAADAASKEISGLEYWSDRKHVLQTEDELGNDPDMQEPEDGDVLGEIRGISEKAQLSTEIRIDRRLMNKGKQTEVSEKPTIDETEPEMPPLGRDDILIPDENSK